jgi:hypothetical protein
MECACVSFGGGKYFIGSFSVICRISVMNLYQIENHSSAVAREMAARDW